MRRAKPVIIHIIWAVAGIAVGATVALLWVKKFESDWVGATGTWFGAIATVLTLLWAVQTFRADQAHRERERAAKEAERVQAILDAQRADEKAKRAAEAALVATANRVTFRVGSGGSGEQRGSKFEITTVVLKVTNETNERVLVKSCELMPPLRAVSAVDEPVSIGARTTAKITVFIPPDADLSP
jgi:hypothetical protein